MESFRKWFYKPKKDDTSLLAQFFYADEDLNTVTAELDSFDGRKDPERCTILVSHLRQCQDKVLNICGKIMNQLIPNERASRDFRVKFPEDVMQENLAGQLWFGAECLAAGSSIMNRENESSAMRPLAKALTKSLENVRNLLREQCFRMNANIQTNNHLFHDKLLEALKIFDRLFAEFELRYVSAMVSVKSPREYYLQQLVVVLFSETLQRALRLNLLSQEMVDDYDPALMFAIPRLAIVSGLLIFPDGPICVDGVPDDTSEMFRPFRFLLRKIRALLLTLSNKELFTLEKLLCSCEDPNIDFSDTNSYSKCIEDNEKQDDYIEDDVDYESIGSSKMHETVTSLPPFINVSESVPSESTNETAFTPTKTDSISISNDTGTSGYLIANQVNLNCITTPNEAPIIVGHSLPDGDEDQSINLVTETLSSLLNTNTDDSSEAVLNSNNINDSENFKNSVDKCMCFDSKCNCFQNVCHCFETSIKNYSESTNFETGIIENGGLTEMLKCQDSVQNSSYLNQSERLVSPDSGLENSELENVMSDRSSDDKMNSPSTSKENSSPSSEKNDFVCDLCGKARKERRCSSLGLIEPGFLDTNSSPFLNQPLKDSSLLDQRAKSIEENKVVEERNEEWYGIATGQGDAKSSDVNFYFQNEEFSESPSQSQLQQNYWSNWEVFIPCNNVGEAQVENNEDSVSLELPANFVINSADERQLTSSSENYRIRTSTLIPLQNFENSTHPPVSACRRLSNLSVARKKDSIKQKKAHKARSSVPNSKENLPIQIASHSKRAPNTSQIGGSLSSSCSSCVTSDTCSLSSETSSFKSELQDDEEIALALKAAEAAYRDDTRARFRSSEDLIHRLFVCIAGVADQLQTNFAGDLRNILKSVFSMNASETEYKDEISDRENAVPNGSDLPRVESAEEAGENSASSEIERTEEPTVSEGNGRVDENRKEKENPPPWIPDVMAPRCMTCEAVFTLVRRRHHCRNCGKVFCARCSSNSVPLPRYGHIKPVRVCNRCFLYQLVNESKHLKDRKIKFKRALSKIPMVDATTVAGLDQVLNLHHMPVKVEFPSTSELMVMEEYRQSANASPRRTRGRPRIDFHERAVKVITDKTGVDRIRKRRGRPSKNKNYNIKPLDCSLCDFRAENFYELEGHIKTHSNQNLFECPYCSSAFSQKGNLITHIRTHTKEKPFKCRICDFAASQKVNLQVHIRIHTKEKPYKCSVCDFSTAQKCNLVAHVTRRHSNVEVVKALETCDNRWGNSDTQFKYYKCGMCMFSCRLKREMVDHVKIQHPFSSGEYQTIGVLK